MAKRVLEVMNPDGPESGRAWSAELGLASRRLPARVVHPSGSTSRSNEIR
jgi:hypothetical protein